MPTYDFLCNDCKQRFEIFLTYAEYGKKPAPCSHCGSVNTRRRMTRVRIAKTSDARMEGMESAFGNFEGLEDDPKALGRMMRKMGKEAGEDLPPEFNDVVNRLESGQSPEEIESALPELGNDDGASGD